MVYARTCQSLTITVSMLKFGYIGLIFVSSRIKVDVVCYLDLLLSKQFCLTYVESLASFLLLIFDEVVHRCILHVSVFSPVTLLQISH